MYAIEMTSHEQYSRALGVLIAVGGTFQGRGSDRQFLLVSDSQYRALVAAGVVEENGTKARSRGKSTGKNRKV